MNTKIALIDSNYHNRPLSLYIRQILEALGELFAHQFDLIVLDVDLFSEEELHNAFKEVSVILSDVPEDQIPQEIYQLLRKESSLFDRQTPHFNGSSDHFGVGYSGVHKNLYYPLLQNNKTRRVNDCFLAMLEATALLLEKDLHLNSEAKLLRTAIKQIYQAENLSDDSFKNIIETEQLHQQLLHIIRSDQWLPEEIHSSNNTDRLTQQVL